MKKRDGFTLIELIVGMAIMAIIFGGIVYIFGASTKAMQAGQNQQQAYEDARVTMDILKTSLRYAVLDDTSRAMSPAQPDKTTTSLTYYTKQFDLHWDVTNGETKIYKVVVDFKTGTNPNSTTAWTSGKKQLVVTITDEDGKQVSKSPFKYPQYETNSGWASDADFPIIYGEENSTDGAFKTGITLYNIHLPFVYKIAGSDKTETLDSRVQPVSEDHYNKVMSDGSGSGTDTTDTTATVTAAAQKMVDQYNLIVSARNKVDAGASKTLTSEEKTAYQAFYKAEKNNAGTYNGLINDYMFNVLYGGAWPSYKVSYSTSNGSKVWTTMYLQPINNLAWNTDATFVILSENYVFLGYLIDYGRAQVVYNPTSSLRKVGWYRYYSNIQDYYGNEHIDYMDVGLGYNNLKDFINSKYFIDNTKDKNFNVGESA